MKISTRRDALFAQLQTVTRAASTRSAVQARRADDVSLERGPWEQDVGLVGGAATFHIRTLRLEAFPPFPEAEGDGRVEVPGPAFVETVLKVARSASRDE